MSGTTRARELPTYTDHVTFSALQLRPPTRCETTLTICWGSMLCDGTTVTYNPLLRQWLGQLTASVLPRRLDEASLF